MMQDYDIAPEFRSLPRITAPSNPRLLRLLNLALRLERQGFAWGDGINVRTHGVRGEDGHLTSVLDIVPKGLTATAPAVINYHGGGFFYTYTASHLAMAQRYALEGGCRVFFPDYRLSVSHPFPAGFNDCYASLSWVHKRAGELGVDPERVVLVGDSAGGALAAGVAQKALDRGENTVCAQVLVCPVTDHEMKSDSAREFTDTPHWNTPSSQAMWKVYLRGTHYARSGGSTPVPQYAAPLHRGNFMGLPSAFVEVAEFDPLRDEGLQYAAALKGAGVAVEAREAKRAVHGYDVVKESPIVETMIRERISALRSFFGHPGTRVDQEKACRP
jgi:acetyl esterase/lipase